MRESARGGFLTKSKRLDGESRFGRIGGGGIFLYIPHFHYFSLLLT